MPPLSPAPLWRGIFCREAGIGEPDHIAAAIAFLAGDGSPLDRERSGQFSRSSMLARRAPLG
jgi:hypothetical protein